MFCFNGVLIKVDQSSVHNVVKKIKLVVTPEVKKTNFNATCRICLNNFEDSDLFSITNHMFGSLTILTAIQECFEISILEDVDLPNCVCSQCASSTFQAYTFKNLILKGEETLKTQAKSTSPTMIDNKDNQNTLMFRASSPPSIVDNRNVIESYEYSIASDHNYSKELTSENSLSAPLKIKKEDEVTDNIANAICDNLGVDITKKKMTRKPLLETLDKWWIRSSGPPYECKLCGRKYGTSYGAFYGHVRSHSNNKMSCLQCGKKYTKDKLKLHMRTHNNEKPFACDQCSARFSLKANLKRHLVIHTGLKPFMCDICGKGFTQNSDMQTHRQVHLGKTKIICEICGKAFVAVTYYRGHKLRCHNKNIKVENKGDENEIYKCKECAKVFSTLQALHQHSTREHTKNGIYKCGICALDVRMNFVRKIHMFMHELQTSSSDNMANNCKFCLATFTNKTNLEEHLLGHIEKPHQCQHCYKSFAKRNKLIYHMLLHTDKRPYQCKECGKTFRRRPTLYQHQNIHSGKKSFLCQICLRRFTQQQQLACHMLTHTGEKKYVCEYCGKAFAVNGNLTVHVRRHTGDTPYCCEICDKGFPDSSSRNKHMRCKHRSESFSKQQSTELWFKEEIL